MGARLSKNLQMAGQVLKDPVILIALIALLSYPLFPQPASAGEALLLEETLPGDCDDITVMCVDMDQDWFLSDDPTALVVVYIPEDDKYLGPMTQEEALGYFDIAEFFVEGDEGYALALAKTKLLVTDDVTYL